MKTAFSVAAVYDRRLVLKSIFSPATVIDRRYRGALLIAAAIFLSACSKLTEANLEKVHNGMSPNEVKAILGSPTSSETSSALGLFTGTTFIYHTSASDVKITFVNDKVMATEGEFK